jgi:hypothetical protein
MILLRVPTNMCKSAGLLSFANRNWGAVIEEIKEISFWLVTPERFFRYGAIFNNMRKNVEYKDVRFPLLVVIRLYID